MKKMIFHHPMPLSDQPSSASEIRPFKMIDAFKHIGYDVAMATGYGQERAGRIADIKQRIEAGEKFDFVYSESSTQPTLLTEENHLPIFPFLDFGFFEYCKQHAIPIGVFYRDIYWRFPEYGTNLPRWKRTLAKFFYRYDLKRYDELIDRLYLPTLQMGQYIPIVSADLFNELPPGHERYADLSPNLSKTSNTTLEILYVGGLGSHYQMQTFFRALKDLPHIHLTVCTRESEWEAARNTYPELSNVTVVHQSGEGLKALYVQADIALLFVEPHEYWKFAAPFKLFEYIGEGKPILSSEGTFAGTFVNDNGIGWSVPYDQVKITRFLHELLSNRDQITEKVQNMLAIRPQHTWVQRALQVVQDLSR